MYFGTPRACFTLNIVQIFLAAVSRRYEQDLDLGYIKSDKSCENTQIIEHKLWKHVHFIAPHI